MKTQAKYKRQQALGNGAAHRVSLFWEEVKGRLPFMGVGGGAG